jgi:stage V sporulation protein B
MKKYIESVRGLVFSGTAKDTYVLFVGNVFSAFWGFLFILIIARALTVTDFGIFSAAINFVGILISLADIGISTGSVNFIVENLAKGDTEKANEYIKASFVIRLLTVLLIFILIIAFAPFIATNLLATKDSGIAVWVAWVSVFWFPVMFFPYVLQGRKHFLQSTIYDNSYYLGRLGFAFAFHLLGMLTMPVAFWAFAAGFLVDLVLTFIFVKPDFIFSKPGRQEYKKLLRFSGWIGINRIVSSVSGKLDVQMLAAMVGAFATGLYSIPSRLASFIIVLSGSYASVLATRFASFGDRTEEKKYLIKSSLAIIPITFLIILWILLAKPFILLLFGQKYLPAVPIFQALAASQIPFLFTVPAVSAIIYAMKKTVYIGALSFFQLAAIFALNYYFIPRYGPFGPTITFGITNTLLAAYVWFLVIKHYFFK